MADFALQIITQEKLVFDRRVISLVAPGGLGSLGILAHHAPLATTLVEGKMKVRESAAREYLFQLQGGFLEMQSNTATVLADGLEILEQPEGEDFGRKKDEE